MPKKSVIVAILGVSLLIGAVVSGCNRNRGRDEFASAKSRRRGATRQNELSSVRNVRPAEVLSASAYRPPVRRQQDPSYRSRQPGYNSDPYTQPSYASAQRRSARGYEPLPEPVPVSQLAVSPTSFGGDDVSYYNRNAPIQTAPAYSPAIYSQPVAAQRPYYEMYTPQPTYTATQPVQVQETRYQAPAARANDPNNPYGHLPEYAYKPRQQSYSPPVPVSAPVRVRPQSPDLAMARAGLDPVPAPPPGGYSQRVPSVQPIGAIGGGAPSGGYGNYRYSGEAVPPVDPRQFPAPLPELEPVRYQRVANNAPESRSVPQIPVLMSSRPQQQQQQQPARQRALAPLDDSGGDWVSSAAVSMFR